MPSQDPIILTREVVGGALYLLYHGLTSEVISKLIKLKDNGNGPEPKVVSSIHKAYLAYFQHRGIQWNAKTVGEQVVDLMRLDQFRALSNMDDACDAILNECEDSQRAKLRESEEENDLKVVVIRILKIRAQFRVQENQAPGAGPNDLVPIQAFKEYSEDPLLSKATLIRSPPPSPPSKR